MKKTLVFTLSVMLFGIACKKEIAPKTDQTSNSTSDSLTVVPPPPVDVETKPKEENIVFFGSSTIAIWNLEASFPGYPVKKAGFGGKTWAGLLQLSDTIMKLNPKQVVIYSGDNDVIARKSVTSMATTIEKICEKIWDYNPNVKVTFLYTKPSDTAFKIKYKDSVTTGIDVIEYTNRNVTNWGKENHPDKFEAIDTYSPFLSWSPKRLNVVYFKSDLLHLNQTYGYPILNALVTPKLIQ
jgi:hypothetical protein